MSAPPQRWTVLSLLEWTADHLSTKGFDEARLHVELLLAHVLRLRRLDLYLQFDRPLSGEELSRFRPLYERRLTHEPLQYILGETEFMGLLFEVVPGVLIPRPETEILVEQAMKMIDRRGEEKTAILDIGCGTGNISIALAKKFPNSSIYSLDHDPSSLALAQRNARRHDVNNIDFDRIDILTESLPGRAFDVVISNPPYIPVAEMVDLQKEVRDFEPTDALTDGGDGLTFYRRIAKLLPGLLKPEGVVAVEVGVGQSQKVLKLFEQAGLVTLRIVKDYSGIDRVVMGGGAVGNPSERGPET